RGPAELVPSTKPVEPAAEENGEHLPIFEAARSDWFEDSVRGDHLPLRRHAAQQPNGRAAEPTGNGAGTLTGAGATRLPPPDGRRPGAHAAAPEPGRPPPPPTPRRPRPCRERARSRRRPDGSRPGRAPAGRGDAGRDGQDGGGPDRGGQGGGGQDRGDVPSRGHVARRGGGPGRG